MVESPVFCCPTTVCAGSQSWIGGHVGGHVATTNSSTAANAFATSTYIIIQLSSGRVGFHLQ